jgi:hypothetical protein
MPDVLQQLAKAYIYAVPAGDSLVAPRFHRRTICSPLLGVRGHPAILAGKFTNLSPVSLVTPIDRKIDVVLLLVLVGVENADAV